MYENCDVMYLDFSISFFKVTSHDSFARLSIAQPALRSAFFMFLGVIHGMFSKANIVAMVASPTPACNRAKIFTNIMHYI